MATDRFTSEQLTAILARLPEAKRAELGWEYSETHKDYSVIEPPGITDAESDLLWRIHHLALLAVVEGELIEFGYQPECGLLEDEITTVWYWLGGEPDGSRPIDGEGNRFTAAAAAYLGESNADR